MGSEDKEAGMDECPHPVRISSFQISKYEVTQAQWRAVMGADPPSLFNKGCDECPVENVSWDDAQAFLKRLNQLTGVGYRLPTEAEWEYAARGGPEGGGAAYQFAGSYYLDEVGWYAVNANESHPVGQKKPNQLGLYDMSGNLWEWCQDRYGPYPCDKKTKKSSDRVLRGGSWNYMPESCRVADRFRLNPGDRYAFVGFRIARNY